MSETKRPTLGSWHVLTGRAVARKRVVSGWNRRQREWIAHDNTPPVDGLYAGWRTVREGKIIWEHDEIYFEHENALEVWLFIVNERQNPIHVFPHQVEWMPDAD